MLLGVISILFPLQQALHTSVQKQYVTKCILVSIEENPKSTHLCELFVAYCAIEVIGEHMMSLRMVVTDDVPDFVLAYADPAYPFKKPMVVKLQDGTTAYYILQKFRDVEDGCKLRLRVVFPAAAPEIMFSEHAEHMAIEFRFGIKTIHAGLF